jgi:hypothetical protein
MASAGQIAFQLSYQISPVILVGGLATGIPGGMLPIVALSQAPNFVEGLLGGSDLSSLDDYLLQFKPLQGSTLVEQKIGTYPFANQQVAANAVIRQPLSISMLMNVTARPNIGGYFTKAAVMAALAAALALHNNSGGLYTVLTPAFIYTNLVMMAIRDVSRGDSAQPQNAYQIDFTQPLVTLAQAQQAQQQLNSTMSQINAGGPTDGATSGIATTIGAPPTVATAALAPVASNLAAVNVGGVGAVNTSPSVGP